MDTETPRRRRAPALVRIALAWSHLIAVVGLLRALAVTAGLAPGWLLARGALGPGAVAVGGALLALVGLLTATLRWKESGHFRRLALLLLVGLNLMVFLLFPPRWALRPMQALGPRFYFETSRAEFALTIDDGLDPETTPALLETLARHNAKATFFVFGESLAAHPALARRCLAQGHELANHQMNDTAAVALAPDELETQIRRADDLLRTITTPRWFRPGGGVVTDRCEQVAGELGMPIVLGSVFPFDSHLASTRFVTAYVASRAESGDIVVLHDGGKRGERTAEALDEALSRLAQSGLRAVTLSELAAP